MYTFSHRGFGVLPLNAPLYRTSGSGEMLPVGGRGGGGITSPIRIAPPTRKINPVAHKPIPVTPKPPVKPPVVKATPIVGNAPIVARPAVPVTTAGQTPLQIAQAQLNSNPCGLTATQWSLLQANNVVPSTLPYASACQLPGASAGVSVLASDSSSTDTTSDLTASLFPANFSWTDVTTWPWWMWAGAAGGAYLLFAGKKKGRR